MRYIIFLIYLFINITGRLTGQPQPKLGIGDAAPPVKALKWIKGSPVNSFQNGRLYLIEFGSTWCVPCAAAIPQLTAMAQKHKEHLTVISFFVMERNTAAQTAIPSYLPHVEKYVRKQENKIDYSVAVDDSEKTMENTWLNAAGRIGIPHIFLIDRDGKIAWIGSNPSVAGKILDRLIDPDQFTTMRDAAANAYNSLHRETHKLPKYDTLSFSLLVRCTQSEESQRQLPFIRTPVKPADGKGIGIDAVAFELSRLFYMAYADTLWNQLHTRNISTLEFPDTIKHPYQKRSYGKYWYEPLLETTDETPFKMLYNYTLKVMGGKTTATRLRARMQHDLREYFDYNVTVQTRDMPCWYLVIGKRKKLDALRASERDGRFKVIENDQGTFNFVNATTRDIIWMLGSNYGYLDYDYGKMPKEDQLPFIDGTGIEYQIDFTFRKDYTFEEFRRYLTTLGLEVVRATRKMKVVVIKDPGT